MISSLQRYAHACLTLSTQLTARAVPVQNCSRNCAFRTLPEAVLGNGSAVNVNARGTLKPAMRGRQCATSSSTSTLTPSDSRAIAWTDSP